MSSPSSECRGRGRVSIPPSTPTLPSSEEAVVALWLVHAGVGCKGKMSVWQQARLEADGPAEARAQALAQLVHQDQVESSSTVAGSKVQTHWSSACQAENCCFLPLCSSALLSYPRALSGDSSGDRVVWRVLAQLCSLPSSLLWLLLV